MTNSNCQCSKLVQIPKTVNREGDNWRFPTMYHCDTCGEDFHCIPFKLNLNA